MSDRDDLTNQDLDRLLAEARGLVLEPSSDLMARILADAAREMPRRAATHLPQTRAWGGWRDWFVALGGWPAAGGLVAATAVGVWIGAAAAAGLSDLAAGVWGEGVSVALGVDEEHLSLLES